MSDILIQERLLLDELGYEYTILENNYDLSIKLDKGLFIRCNMDRLRCEVNRILTQPYYDLPTGIFWTSRFNQSNFLANHVTFDIPSLNAGAQCFRFFPIRNQRLQKLSFVKPDNDLKSFDATLIPPNERIVDFITFNYPEDINSTGCVITNHLKIINNESRFFVVDGKVITGSYYRSNNKLYNQLITPEEESFKKAQEYTNKYSPCKAYVIDLALVGNEYQVIEYNSINCAGLYAADYGLILEALSAYFDTLDF